MKAAVIKRKNCYDIVFLTEDNKIADIYEVKDVIICDSIDTFEREVLRYDADQNFEFLNTEC